MPMPHTPAPARILLVRADAIGDHILFSGILPHLKSRFPDSRIALACPDSVAELFRACPFLDELFPFNKRRLHRRAFYRLWLSTRIRLFRADWAINTVFSRDSASDLVTAFSGARVRVAHHGDLSNMKASKKAKADSRYSHMIEAPSDFRCELDHHADLLAFLDAPGNVEPRVWIPDSDKAWAAKLLADHGIAPASALAIFPSPLHSIRLYPYYTEILANFQKHHPAPILALGAEADLEEAERILRPLTGPRLNLCGKTTLTQAGALLQLCRAGFGAETGLAHLAAAVSCPHAVLLGGGHFGRFMPSSPHTHAACHPLDCFGCNWSCTQNRPICIQDIPTPVIQKALDAAWTSSIPGPLAYAESSRLPISNAWCCKNRPYKSESVRINSSPEGTKP